MRGPRPWAGDPWQQGHGSKEGARPSGRSGQEGRGSAPAELFPVEAAGHGADRHQTLAHLPRLHLTSTPLHPLHPVASEPPTPHADPHHTLPPSAPLPTPAL